MITSRAAVTWVVMVIVGQCTTNRIWKDFQNFDDETDCLHMILNSGNIQLSTQAPAPADHKFGTLKVVSYERPVFVFTVGDRVSLMGKVTKMFEKMEECIQKNVGKTLNIAGELVTQGGKQRLSMKNVLALKYFDAKNMTEAKDRLLPSDPIVKVVKAPKK